MASGGARSGAPGQSYSNRTDLNAQPRQPIRVASGQPYGERKAQEDAQRALPLPGQQPFARPSERPDEPVTAGLPLGGGPGPEVLSAGALNAPDVLAQLRALYMVAPYEDLRMLIERVERSGQ